MLFDFHQKQNAKKPGSVHATYLITGTRTPPKPQQQPNTNTQVVYLYRTALPLKRPKKIPSQHLCDPFS
jgi:hypothetical protein